MYSKLRSLRSLVSEIESELEKLASEKEIKLEDLIEEFDGIIHEDCGEYCDPHFLHVS